LTSWQGHVHFAVTHPYENTEASEIDRDFSSLQFDEVKARIDKQWKLVRDLDHGGIQDRAVLGRQLLALKGKHNGFPKEALIFLDSLDMKKTERYALTAWGRLSMEYPEF